MSGSRLSAAQADTLQRRRCFLEHDGVREMLREHVPCGALRAVRYALQDESPDRFILRVDAVTEAGARSSYAFKAYADDRGGRLFDIAQRLRARHARTGLGAPVCLPLAYVADLGLLIFPWVEGEALRTAVRKGDLASVAHAASHAPATLAWVHKSDAVAETPVTARAVMERTRRRCARLARWPAIYALVEPALEALERAVPRLVPCPPRFVHGDPGPANLLYDGRRWVLIDFDRCGHADAAYDAGYLAAQLHRRCLQQPALAPHVPRLLAALRRACRAALPDAAAANIDFYYAATLLQKLYMNCREHPEDPRAAAEPLARHACAALGRLH